MGENMKRILPIFIILVIIIAVIFVFFKNNDKIKNFGNNISTTEDLQNYILNITSYEAKVEVTVQSNKTTNTYKLKQKYSKEGTFKQEVLEPENIAGTIIIQDGENLKLENTRLNLQKIYENYNYIANNNLCLEYFIKDFLESQDASTREENGSLILETTVKNESKYISKKVLYVDTKTGKPTKMEIKDHTQNTIVYILYNEININSLQKMEVLAFKLL